MNTPTSTHALTPQTHQQVMVVEKIGLTNVRRGILPGIAGVVVAAILLVIYTITSTATNVLATALLSGMITNPVTLTAIAVLLGIFGLCFCDASCMLLGGAALVGAFLVNMSTFLGLIPAVLMMVSHIQMKQRYMLQVKRVAIDSEIKK